MTSIATHLLGQTRSAVLGTLLLHPEDSLHVHELARRTGASAGSLHRELRALAELGVLLRQEVGRQVHYRANPSSPVFAELAGLLRKTAGLADVLREALAGVEGVHLAFVFGSMAKGTFDARSDVDLLIAGEASFAEISNALRAAEERLGREVTPTVYSFEELSQKVAEGHHFLTRVLSEPKIMLRGNEDDLARVGRPAS
jgi:predicted nucleotidyltransferase